MFVVGKFKASARHMKRPYRGLADKPIIQ